MPTVSDLSIIRRFNMKRDKIIELYDDEDLLLCEEYAIDIYAGEILTEFATVQRDNRFNMCVAVNPDRKRNLKNTEYFKVYNHIDPTKATKIARIKFRECEYVIHNNNGGKKNWKLNSKERKQLMKILISPSKNFPDKRVWDELIRNYNNEAGFDSLPKKLVIPDYVNWLYDII